MADPNDPQKKRTIVSADERERLGLKPHTWNGVVDPQVYSRLDHLNKLVADSTERLKAGKDTEAFNTLTRIRFPEMAYVEGQVKDKNDRYPVLEGLKASEFYVLKVLDNSAGFVGYASKEALDKLAKSPQVAGVCIDDKPLPETPQTIYRRDLPPAKPEEATNEPGVAEQKVDPDVYRALASSDRVRVWIELKPDSLTKLNKDAALTELRAQNELLKESAKQLRDRILSTVTASDFALKAGVSAGMSGFISKAGLQKLWKHPDVVRVELPRLAQPK